MNFKDLIVLDMANNHQGSLVRGLEIIRLCAEAVGRSRAAMKFQFRDLSVLVHEEYLAREDVPHIPRFKMTRLNDAQYGRLVDAARKEGLLTCATPFDEVSVDLVEKLGIDILKIASCSAGDWPLLTRAARTDKPMIVSTAGMTWGEMDMLVDWLQRKGVEFALNHCVALYPALDEYLQLRQIALMKERYPGVEIGWSTHEYPNNFDAVGLAYALGARMFECHVDLDDEKRNAYSRTPSDVEAWLESLACAKDMIGADERLPSLPEERKSLQSLQRGVYENEAGLKLFQMPLEAGEESAGEYYERTFVLARENIAARRHWVQAKSMLAHAKVIVPEGSATELSHHYGFLRFREFGAIWINVVRGAQYAKKLGVMLPRQKHPYHYHTHKTETFLVLSGDLDLVVDGKKIKLEKKNLLTIEPYTWHKFSTMNGCIFEEVSTEDEGDSVYEDSRINRNTSRKTQIIEW